MKKSLIVIGIVILAGALGGLLFWQDMKNGVQENGKLLPVGEEIADQGRQHIPVGSQHEPYNSNPPTSGPHYEVPANWGVYQQSPLDEQLIHNLEHGGIWISYRDIDNDTKAKLEEIGRQHPGSVIVAPRLANDSKIAIASWRRLTKLDSFDRDVIEKFIKHNINNSPEPLAR